jgi:peptidoglycan/LPS O-acetylase OafA/YrhL
VVYRGDIDGLRALAVVAVMLYHADAPWFAGGFVGVDVFFVISGFLIAALILHEQQAGSFSLWDFYCRRIRRIVPALFVMMAACAAVGWFILSPHDYRSLGRTILAAVFSVSNMKFWGEAGYFDAAPVEKPLLHTWSLGVEEQFYMVLPLLMVLIARYCPAWRLRLIVLLAVLSFVASCALIAADHAMAAFYLVPSRMWELLAGVLLAAGVVPAPRNPAQRGAAAFAGLALLGGAIVGLSAEVPFPGAYALIPVMGAVLVIWAGCGGASPVAHWLASTPMVFAGKISYSLYLWHFPMLAFVAYLSLGRASPTASAIALIAVVPLAILSWYCVEQPVRRAGPRLSRRALVIATAAGMLVLVEFAIAANVTGGFSKRFDLARVGLSSIMPIRNLDRLQCFAGAPKHISTDRLCGLGAPRVAQPSFVLWGDSHGEGLRPALDAAARQQGRLGVFAGQQACPPLIGVTRPSAPQCASINQAILDYILASAAVEDVMLSARWAWWAEGTRYRNEPGPLIRLLPLIATRDGGDSNLSALEAGLARTVAVLTAAGKRVWLIGPVPEVGLNVPNYFYLRSAGLTDVEAAPTWAAFKARQANVLPLLDRIQHRYPVGLVWPHALLCNGASCRIASEGKMLYFDDDHLSTYGAELLAPVFVPALQRLGD